MARLLQDIPYTLELVPGKYDIKMMPVAHQFRACSLLHSRRGFQEFPGRLRSLLLSARRTTGNSAWKQGIPKAVPGRSVPTLGKMVAPMDNPAYG